jgi:predicted ribosomally synthesized peptide with SipW-like signal peptide
MSQKRTLVNTTRRNVLAGIGAVGLASAGAGLGTTAFFSDRESFANNGVRAGQLDLLLDWQQTYTGPDGTVPVNAYPDADEDGVQDAVPQSFVVWAKKEGYDLSTVEGESAAVEAFKDAYFADVGAGGDWETPLVALEDVKPGDFGEVTFSMHFFNNPAYVRLVGDLVEEAENGLTEPESEVDETPDEGELAEHVDVLLWADDGDNVYEPKHDEEVDVVVLFDTSCSMVWADSSAGCNESENTAAPEKFEQAKAGAVALFEELLAAPDVSGLGLPAEMVPNADVRVGLIEYGNDTGVRNSLGSDPTAADLAASVDGMSAGNGTELPSALELAKDEISQYGREDAHTCVVIVGDGQPHEEDNNVGDAGYDYDGWGATYSVELTDELEEMGATVLTVHYEVDPGVDLVTGIDEDVVPAGYDDGGDGVDTLELFEIMASPAADDGEVERLAFAADRDRITCVLEKIALRCAGEVPLFYGAFDDALDALDDGVLLVGNPRTVADPDSGEDDVRACLEWSCTYFVGFEWSVDPEVGNEIQTDSLAFELGFEAEQCRHNDAPFSSGEEAVETAD